MQLMASKRKNVARGKAFIERIDPATKKLKAVIQPTKSTDTKKFDGGSKKDHQCQAVCRIDWR